MTASYLVRLLLLSGAVFFVVTSVLASLVALLAPTALRRAETMSPVRAARYLLSLRLLPAAIAAVAVVAFCIPAYLLFEPQSGGEEIGFVCLSAAILGVGLGGGALYEALQALTLSFRFLRNCEGRESGIDRQTVWIVPGNGVLALAGILRPRLLISSQAIEQLSSGELAVVLRHENAHLRSRDNLKRLLIRLAPPVFSRLRALEKAWAKYAEWAADDQAVNGDAEQSATLAAALIRVARLQSNVAVPPLMASLVEANEDLSARVERLLCAAPVAEPRFRSAWLVAACAACCALAMNPASLRVVHRLLERLLD